MEEIEARYRTARIISIAMLGGIFVDAVIAYAIYGLQTPFEGLIALTPDVLRWMRYAFFAVGIGDVFLSHFLRMQILYGQSGADTAPPSPVRRLFTANILVAAVCESIAILGLALFLIGGHLTDFLVMMGASLVFAAFYFPRLTDWEAYVQEALSGNVMRDS